MNLSEQFPQDKNIAYLNHAAMGPWPKVSCDAIKQFTNENLHLGAKNYLQWLEIENQLREQMRILINAPSNEDIALTKNTSEALSFIAYGIDWKKNDNIVLALQEFPSNRIVWESLKAKFDVEVRIVDLEKYSTPEEGLLSAIDKNTRLLTTSSVHYANGIRMNLKKLGDYCHEKNILFCIDAIQSLGALTFDAQDIHADFVVADGHKWMLGPEGLALFYCRADLREQLKLYEYGWHMVENSGDYNTLEWQPAKTAQRFECGSPNMLAAHALNSSLKLLTEIGISKIEEMLLDNIYYLIEQLQIIDNIKIHSITTADRMSGIVNFSHPAHDSTTLYKSLMDNNVICAARGAGVRFSPHFYTPRNVIDLGIKRLKDIL